MLSQWQCNCLSKVDKSKREKQQKNSWTSPKFNSNNNLITKTKQCEVPIWSPGLPDQNQNVY